MYEVILFDLDGTLLDTLDDLHVSVNAALSYPPRTREEVRAFVGNGIAKLIERAIGSKTPDFDEVLQAFKTHYFENCMVKTKPYAGIIELLRTLQAQGIKAAVVSNKADAAVQTLSKAYFGDLLCMSVGEDEGRGIRKKPAPDTLLQVLQTLGVAKEKTVYVGDSEVDIQTAQNAGIPCISVTWGFKDKDFLVENGGQIFADSTEELLSLCIR